MELSDIVLPIFLFLIAFLYSSVGHAGASGYLAVMGLMGVAPNEMRSAALILNILVAVIASYKYLKAKCFKLKILLPFAVTSIPFAFIGGAVQLPSKELKIAIALVIILSAFCMILRIWFRPDYELRKLPMPIGILAGSIIGFLSGLTAVGGGIFLSPLLIFFQWSTIREASGIAAVFILLNSISGLLGQFSKGIQINNDIWIWALAVVAGGYIGSELGSKKLNNRAIIYFLFGVLVIASIKMLIV